jgi:glycosyltransferase 2 family protein
MRLAVNLALSLGMLALCVWLVWPDAKGQHQLAVALESLRAAELAPYVAGTVGLFALMHLCRALRWNHLLAPLGVRIPPGKLLAISSVGFMAIIALPARLGELVRPALIRKRGEISASAALGTVAVERAVDGLLVSVFVAGAFLALRGPDAPWWMMPTALAALGAFVAATLFFAFAMRRPDATVRWALKLSLAERLAPRAARVLEGKLREMIRGFVVLARPRDLAAFVAWSVVYWGANGLAVWLLARGFHLHLSVVGAFATMGLVAVGITLPNSPGMVGQFHWFTLLGLSLYLGPAVLDDTTPIAGLTLAYAIALHGLQTAWYAAMGMIGMASSHVSFAELWRSRKLDPDPAGGDDAAR